MNKQMIVWFLVAAVPVLVFVFSLINKFRGMNRPEKEHSRPFMEMGTDEEIFYCPGDERK